MDKKKTTYYYNAHTENLISTGMKAHIKNQYGVTTMKLTTFIDKCIEDAVVTLPHTINQLTEENNKQAKTILKLRKEIESIHLLLSQINRNSNEKKLLEEAVSECLLKR